MVIVRWNSNGFFNSYASLSSNQDEVPYYMAINNSLKYLYVAGYTADPVSTLDIKDFAGNSFQRTPSNADANGVLFRFNLTGSSSNGPFVSCSGNNVQYEIFNALTLDSAGNVYVTIIGKTNLVISNPATNDTAPKESVTETNGTTWFLVIAKFDKDLGTTWTHKITTSVGNAGALGYSIPCILATTTSWLFLAYNITEQNKIVTNATVTVSNSDTKFANLVKFALNNGNYSAHIEFECSGTVKGINTMYVLNNDIYIDFTFSGTFTIYSTAGVGKSVRLTNSVGTILIKVTQTLVATVVSCSDIV
jgi:hypothetical protein